MAGGFRDWVSVGGDVETYYGRQTAGELLERTVWHAAQHLRQLYALLGRMGLSPDGPLAECPRSGDICLHLSARMRHPVVHR